MSRCSFCRGVTRYTHEPKYRGPRAVPVRFCARHLLWFWLGMEMDWDA